MAFAFLLVGSLPLDSLPLDSLSLDSLSLGEKQDAPVSPPSLSKQTQVLLQFADFDIAEFNRITMAGKAEEAGGAIFTRMWCVGHQILYGR